MNSRTFAAERDQVLPPDHLGANDRITSYNVCYTKLLRAGKLRVEGKDYVIQDGDVVHFRFNV